MSLVGKIIWAMLKHPLKSLFYMFAIMMMLLFLLNALEENNGRVHINNNISNWSYNNNEIPKGDYIGRVKEFTTSK